VLFIGTDAVKIFSKVNSLGFVLNERLTVANNFRKVCQKVNWILRSLRPQLLIRHLRSEKGLCCRLSYSILITAILYLLMLRHGVELGWNSGFVYGAD
jgi:hypothetical protein